MDNTHAASNNHRNPTQWNTVPVPERVSQRAITNVDVNDGGCWISRYSTASHGYSQVGWQEAGNRHVVLGHRAAWVAVNGQVPMGMTIDHTCKVRQCVNPAHLRLLPNFENARRTNGDDWAMGTCRNGHSNAGLVTMARRTKSGERRYGLTCGQCMKDSRARWVTANPVKLRESKARSEAKRKARA